MKNNFRLALVKKDFSSDADGFVPHGCLRRSEFRSIASKNDHREDLIRVRLAKVEKGRRLWGLRQIRHRGDRPAHCSSLTDMDGSFFGTEGRRMRRDWEQAANRRNEQSCPREECPRTLQWRPGIHLPVTTAFVRWRWESGMTSRAAISSTSRPSGARAQAAKTENPASGAADRCRNDSLCMTVAAGDGDGADGQAWIGVPPVPSQPSPSKLSRRHRCFNSVACEAFQQADIFLRPPAPSR
jgi:hypothetical protein